MKTPKLIRLEDLAAYAIIGAIAYAVLHYIGVTIGVISVVL